MPARPEHLSPKNPIRDPSCQTAMPRYPPTPQRPPHSGSLEPLCPGIRYRALSCPKDKSMHVISSNQIARPEFVARLWLISGFSATICLIFLELPKGARLKIERLQWPAYASDEWMSGRSYPHSDFGACSCAPSERRGRRDSRLSSTHQTATAACRRLSCALPTSARVAQSGFFLPDLLDAFG